MKKRVLSLLLVLVMLLSLLPTAALADETQDQPSDQDETVLDPEETTQDEPEQEVDEVPAPDAAVQAVQALIDALPDEATAENADEIAARLAAIDEAMAALTEEQVAALDTTRYEALCEALTALPKTQETSSHTHYLCGGSTCTGVGGHQESGKTNFDKVLSMSSDGKLMMGDTVCETDSKVKYYLLPDGNYRLDANLDLGDKGIQVSGDVNLCLNGHNITTSAGTVIYVSKKGTGSNFSLTDCHTGEAQGHIQHNAGTTGRGLFVGTEYQVPSSTYYTDTFNMYGGIISDNDCRASGSTFDSGGGLCVAAVGKFNMYGGSITDNHAQQGGGLYIQSATSGKFVRGVNLYGGTISNNGATKDGGGVYVNDVYSIISFTMTGGTITKNGAGGNGAGVFVEDDAQFIVSGTTAKVTKNVNSENMGNVYLETSGSSTATIRVAGPLSDGTNHAVIGVTTEKTLAAGESVQIAVGKEYKLTGADTDAFTSDKGYQVLLSDDGKSIDISNAAHVHPICGKECKHIGTDGNPIHPNVTWTGIDNPSDAETKEGTYFYLLSDYQIPSTSWQPEKDNIVLDLCGHKLIQNSPSTNTAAITVLSGKTLTITDCEQNGKAGQITHAKGTTGNGVQCYGNFIIYGGKITGNNLTGTGHYPSNRVGAGVYVSGDSAKLTIGGNTQITGNKSGKDNSNVYLAQGRTITIDSSLTSAARIGIRTSDDLSGQIASGANNSELNYTNIFTPDMGDGAVIYQEETDLYLAPHRHPVCGKSCAHTSRHEDEDWKAWNDPTSLPDPDTNGYWYLTTNVTLSETWVPRYGTSLCLNGHTITANFDGAVISTANYFALTDCHAGAKEDPQGCVQHGSRCSGVGINVTGDTVYLYGGTITKNTTGVSNSGKFAMYGGSITGNDASSSSAAGGLQNTGNPGAAYLYGGSITNNKGYYGGVYVGDYGSLTVGGKFQITGNHGNQSGGVYFASYGKLTVFGEIQITGNTYTFDGKKVARNVYLSTDSNGQKTLTVGALTTGKDGAKIGVTTKTEPNSYYPKTVLFGTGSERNVTDPVKGCFFADNGTYVVTREGTALYLSIHKHTYAYALDTEHENTIKITCTADGCPLDKGYVGSVTLGAPAHTVYGDGNEAHATLTWSEGSTPAFGRGDIKYYKDSVSEGNYLGEGDGKAPTDAGNYIAVLTCGEVSVQVSYTIEKAVPQYVIPSGLSAKYGQTLADVTLPTGWNWQDPLTTSVGDVGKKNFKATYTPEDKQNYNPVSDIDVEVTVGKATRTINATDKTLTKNGVAVNISDWASIGDTEGTIQYALVGEPAGITLNGKQLSAAGNTTVTNFQIKVTVAETANYQAAEAFITVTVVEKQPVTVTISGMPTGPVTYGDTFTLKATQTGDNESADGVWTFSVGSNYRIVESNAQTGTIKLQAVNCYSSATSITATYTSTTHQGSKSDELPSVKQKVLTASDFTYASSITKVYDGTDKHTDVIGFTLKTGAVYGDYIYFEVAKDNIIYNSANVADAKSATVTMPTSLTGGTNADCYKLSETTTTISATITPKPITIATATAASRTYEKGNKNVDVAVTFNGALSALVKDTDYTVTGTMADDTAGTAKDMDVTVTLTNPNYSLAQNTTTTTVTIGKLAAPTVTVSDISQKWSDTTEKELMPAWQGVPEDTGTKNFSVTVQSYPAGVSLSGLSMDTATGRIHYALSGATAANVGDNIVLDVLLTSQNYEDVTFTLTIRLTDKDDPTVTPPAPAKEAFVYDGTEQILIGAGSTTGGTMQYSLDGEHWSTELPAAKNAGKYTVYYKVVGDVNFNDVAAQHFDITIEPRTIIITAKDQSAYVGDKAPTLGEDSYTVSGLVNGETLKGNPNVAYASTPDMTKAGEVAIKVSGAVAPDGDNYTIQYVDGNLTIANRPSSGVPTYPVNTPSTADNGSVSASTKNAASGSTVTITVKPDEGYQLSGLTVTDSKGNVLPLTDLGNGKYSFVMPASKVDVSASFTKVIETSPFKDVAASAYYYDAVKWAVENGITDGVGNGLFAPNAACTRAQIVTFLWRAAGSPEPKSMNSFTDVAADAYYAKAVAWAVENGITTGTAADKFSPNAPCTRAQAVTFLFRAAKASATGAPAFSDVAANAYYAEAVKWAVDNGVTDGVGNGKFAPNDACTRAQIVTFLWRLHAGK